MTSLSLVRSSAHSMRRTSSSLTPSRRPMNRIRTPSSWSSGVSLSIRSANMRINPSTSSVGRDQFSVENEKTVSSSTPRSTASRSRSFTTSAPARCPSIGVSPRRCAHLPLPSVMIATYLGTDVIGSRRSSGELGSGPELHLEDLLLFAFQLRFDLADRLVGEPLELALRPALVVLADLPLLLQLPQVVHDVAADVAHGHATLLRHRVHDLDEIPPALLVQLRDLKPHHIAVVGRRQSQVRLHDRLLDLLDGVLVVRRERQEPSVRGRHLGELA